MSDIELTNEQADVVDDIRDWFWRLQHRRGTDQCITVGGLAGTGKTTLANMLPERLEIARHKVAYCAYTGKAASRLNGGSTIHRLIYKPREQHCEKCPKFIDKELVCHGDCADCTTHWDRIDQLSGLDLVIVDEASMVDYRIFEDLTSFGVPVVWIGDHGQLPPIWGTFNLMADPQLRLETIHRQLADSPILKLAMQARRNGRVPFGFHGPGVLKRHRNGHYPLFADLLLCGRNNTRVALNAAARAERGFPEDRPVAGDRVVCLRNNHDLGVYNGITARVTACTEDPEDVECWKLSVELDGPERERITDMVWRGQFGQLKTLADAPRGVGLWDYGYALTVHKAQGSEAERVVLLEQPVTDPRRWLYTGITRARRSLEIIAR
jgi:exodeoxyribonuclease-5